MSNNENVKVEETSTDFKKLHGLVESNEFAEFFKRVSEIRKRVDKLYAAERARLSDIRERRARAEEEERNAVEAQRQAEIKAAEAPAPAPAAQAPAPDVSGSAPAPAESAPEQTPEAPAPEPTGNTRTAIPSYIRGVVKHTPRPATSAQGATRGAAGTRTSAPRPASPRPTAAKPGAARGGSAPMPKFEPPAASRKREAPNKKAFVKPEDKKQMSKRMLIRKGYIQENMDEERMGTRKLKNKKVSKVVPFAPIKIENAVITTENLTVKILSEKIGKTAQEIIKQLMELGIMTTINSVVDFPTMQLVADALGVNIELKLEKTKEEELKELHAEPDPEESLVKRPPIITVMGHVDHGKTSLLDAIRKTSVVSGEAGGITQHIGAYSVDLNGEKITFLDTPGHEAFTEMRKRGATVTDIAVLIVAADDGVMPQTVEAIHHAQAAGVPIVVAINKIDKPGANPEKIKQQLAEHEVLCEDWGGDVPMIPISAKQNKGIDTLLENILLLAEIKGYRANPSRSARGYVVEARLDKGRGPIANTIIQNGTLHVGDYVVSGTTYGRVRMLTDDKGRNIKSAGPSTPVSIFGLADVPSAGDSVVAVDSEKMARQVIEEREARKKLDMLSDTPTTDFEEAFKFAANEKVKEYKVCIKADVQGSAEALKESLNKLSNDEVKVNVVHAGVGAINQSDVMLADVAKACIIGFNVKPDAEGRTAAERMGVKIGLYSIIYEVLDDVQAAMDDMLAPKFVERVTGKAQVRMTFKVSGIGIVAGSYVQTGKVVRNGKARVFRNGKLIHEGDIIGLKRYKDDAKEVTIGLECGIAVDGFTDFAENDEIECYVVERESKESK